MYNNFLFKKLSQIIEEKKIFKSFLILVFKLYKIIGCTVIIYI